jgi:hypothetical protein
MASAVQNAPPRFQALGHLQDIIGWRRFLEGMISKEIIALQQHFHAINGSQVTLDRWSSGLITRLLKVTHGQGLYQNFIVHDPVSRTIATAKKEELLLEVERQRDLGDTGLLEEDKYLVEVNLGDMETTSGECQRYWLLAIKTAWKAKLLREQQGQQQTVSGETTLGTGLVITNFQHFYKVRDISRFHFWFAFGKPSSVMLLRIATYTRM